MLWLWSEVYFPLAGQKVISLSYYWSPCFSEPPFPVKKKKKGGGICESRIWDLIDSSPLCSPFHGTDMSLTMHVWICWGSYKASSSCLICVQHCCYIGYIVSVRAGRCFEENSTVVTWHYFSSMEVPLLMGNSLGCSPLLLPYIHTYSISSFTVSHDSVQELLIWNNLISWQPVEVEAWEGDSKEREESTAIIHLY